MSIALTQDYSTVEFGIINIGRSEAVLHSWPALIKAVQIDANNVTNKKDNPRVWFEYKPGYSFLEEDESNKKETVTVQSFSTDSTTVQTPAPKRRRPGAQAEAQGSVVSPVNASERGQSQNRNNHTRERAAHVENDNEHYVELARTLYATPASSRRGNREDLINQFINNTEDDDIVTTEQHMFNQITN